MGKKANAQATSLFVNLSKLLGGEFDSEIFEIRTSPEVAVRMAEELMAWFPKETIWLEDAMGRQLADAKRLCGLTSLSDRDRTIASIFFHLGMSTNQLLSTKVEIPELLSKLQGLQKGGQHSMYRQHNDAILRHLRLYREKAANGIRPRYTQKEARTAIEKEIGLAVDDNLFKSWLRKFDCGEPLYKGLHSGNE